MLPKNIKFHTSNEPAKNEKILHTAIVNNLIGLLGINLTILS